MAGPIPGKLSRLYVSTDGGTTWLRVGGRVDLTLNINRGEIDASHMDSGSWSEFLPGRRDWSIDGTVRYIEGDPGQEALVDQAFAVEDEEALLKVRFMLREDPGQSEFVGDVFVTSESISVSDEAPADMAITLRGTGPLVRAEQDGEPGGVEG